MLYRVYVDEAGDRGISAGSDRHFVVSAVIVPDSGDAQLRSDLAELRASLGRHPGHVLHFVKFNHSQRLKAAQDVARFSFAAITNVIVHKDLIGQPHPAGETSYIARPDPMYLWALRLLLERISWYVDDNDGDEAIVTFSRLKGFKPQKLHDYRTALETSDGVDIAGTSSTATPFASTARRSSNSCRSPISQLRPYSEQSSQMPTGTPSRDTWTSSGRSSTAGGGRASRRMVSRRSPPPYPSAAVRSPSYATFSCWPATPSPAPARRPRPPRSRRRPAPASR